MKTAASIQTPMFYNSALPMTGAWGSTSQRIRRRQPRVFRLSNLTGDELAAKQEMVCGGILGLCLFYTVIQCFIQLA